MTGYFFQQETVEEFNSDVSHQYSVFSFFLVESMASWKCIRVTIIWFLLHPVPVQHSSETCADSHFCTVVTPFVSSAAFDGG